MILRASMISATACCLLSVILISVSCASSVSNPEHSLRQRAIGYSNVIKDILNGENTDTTNAQKLAKYEYPEPITQPLWNSIYSYIDSIKSGISIARVVFMEVGYIKIEPDGKNAIVSITKVVERIAQPTATEPVGHLNALAVLTLWENIDGEWYYTRQTAN